MADLQRSSSRRLILRIGLLATSLLLADLLVRSIVTRDGHIEYLFGKPWRYLVPFDQPSEFPSATPQPGAYRRYDPVLGWTIAESGQEPPLYFSDRNGYRCSQAQFEASKKTGHGPERVDVIAIGDSFTHGDEVLFEQSWPHQLELKSGLRVLNLGVGGYGVDQAILRYERAGQRARTVLLGLVAGDLERSLTTIYALTRGGLKTKPVFSFENGSPHLLNQPALFGDALEKEFLLRDKSTFLMQDPTYDLPLLFRDQLLDFSHLYRTGKSFFVWRKLKRPPVYRTDDERLAFCLDILSHLRTLTTQRGTTLVVVLLGNNNTFADRRERGLDRPWTLLENSLERRGIAYLNAADAMSDFHREDPARVINSSGLHYTPWANAKVAEMIVASGLLEDSSLPGPRDDG